MFSFRERLIFKTLIPKFESTIKETVCELVVNGQQNIDRNKKSRDINLFGYQLL